MRAAEYPTTTWFNQKAGLIVNEQGDTEHWLFHENISFSGNSLQNLFFVGRVDIIGCENILM